MIKSYYNLIMIEFRIKQLTFMRDEDIHIFIAVKFETTGSFDRNLRKRINILYDSIYMTNKHTYQL